MQILALDCPRCGGALPSDAAGREVVCGFCHQAVLVDPGSVAAATFHRALKELDATGARGDAPTISVGDVVYRLGGRVARGESCDLFVASRARAPVERVLIKVLRARADADLLAREFETLKALHRSTAQGASHFSERLPQLVAHGDVAGHGAPATVLRLRSGFIHTLEDARRHFSAGIDPKAAIWVWRRLLELLGFVHRSGYVHGAVLPQHVLIHSRDHGAVLAGWSCSVKAGAKLPAVVAAQRAFYPAELLAGGASSVATDLAMTARCILAAVGGDPATGTVPATVAAPVAGLLRTLAAPDARLGGGADAWAMKEQVAEVAREAFGPPAFHPFQLPGW